ncbi:zinc finger protein 878-like isoform X1 [Pogonomyrmex barbatus]|uniref:Zinc finger protein 878-like isoform X1 n=1 Tax=Pogonomyrmex barbatus TaxID=144034 RepID=A0A6I9WQ18_9HYME|nr:zinc finger protein 878-like isoform X1 [Pogonomyrmex barbatus]
MAVPNDDAMVNNSVRAERLVGDECRICLKSCTEACQLFRDGGGIPEKLMAVAAVQIEEGDGLPTSICLSCNHLLDVSYDFKCQIQNSDLRLRQILKLQIQSTLDDKSAKDTMMIKDIVDVVSNVTLGKKDHVIEHDIYSSHDMVMFENTVVQSDVVINDESHISHKFMQKTEIIESNEKDVQYNTLKENVHNAEIMEAALCHESHMVNAIDHSDRLSNSTTEDRFIKQKQRILAENNETLRGLIDENREDILKTEIKNDILLNNFDDNVSKETAVLGIGSQNTKSIMNCSDDEEKPLISRTIRQKCLHCIKSFATKMALQRHMNVHKHKTKLRYVCVVCNKHFSNISKLKSHMSTCHETQITDSKVPQEDKKANKVSAKITRSSNMTDSMKEEKKNFKFTCKVCSKQFIYQKSFLSHAKNHPEYNIDISDDVLDQSMNKPSEQKDRIPTFRENESEEEEEEEDDDDSDLPIKSLQCTQCGKLFATKRNLKRHISTHSGLKFNCSTCGKGFSRIDKLKDHEQSKHKEEIFGNTDDDDDDEEDNESKINENSENRKKDRHNRPHKCALCPKAFAQAQSLANHVERHKRVKDTQKRFLCEKCSKCFAQSGSLVAHMRTHTGIKPYVCNVCSRAFTKSTYLQLHLRTHSGEKPYICQYCSRAFARANTLARHITMHTGEAKYHCSICTKSFRRLTSLNEHMYTHTGQRPYACKLCTKRYNNAGSLYAHTKKCKAQQLSGSTTTAFTVSAADNAQQQNDTSMPQLLIYSQRKLVEEAAVGQVVSTPQYMVANVHNQKTVPTNVIQPFTVEDPNMYNSKQFKNSYYAIYPNM